MDSVHGIQSSSEPLSYCAIDFSQRLLNFDLKQVEGRRTLEKNYQRRLDRRTVPIINNNSSERANVNFKCCILMIDERMIKF